MELFQMVKKYLFDIQQSLVSIETFIGDKKDFSAYMQNKMLRRAVEREFEIMGEAMNKLDKVDPAIPISSKTSFICPWLFPNFFKETLNETVSSSIIP